MYVRKHARENDARVERTRFTDHIYDETEKDGLVCHLLHFACSINSVVEKKNPCLMCVVFLKTLYCFLSLFFIDNIYAHMSVIC